MSGFDAHEMSLQRRFERLRQHRQAIFRAFAIADGDLIIMKIDVFDAQSHTLHQSQAGAVEQAGHQPERAIEAAENRLDFGFCEDEGQLGRRFRVGNIAEPVQRLFENIFIEKQDGAEGLILGSGGDVAVDSQMREEVLDFAFAHCGRVTFAVKENEFSDPAHIGIFGANAVVSQAYFISHLFE